MTIEKLYTYIHHPELIDNDIFLELEELIKEYPYFYLARILYLKTLYSKNIEIFRQELSKSTIHLPEKKQLFKYLNANSDLSSFMKNNDVLKENSKEKDTNKSEHKEEDLLEFEVNDIKEGTEYKFEEITKDNKEENKEETKENQQLIDDFIKNTPRISKTINKEHLNPILPEKTELDEVCMTETLAKIYVKQKLYSKAILVYEKLSLKNPQKSVYFVSNISEIKKLINDKL
jgi:hypothetical protein